MANPLPTSRATPAEPSVYAIHHEDEARWCTQQIMEVAHRVGFSERACWEIGIAVSELATNICKHAHQGTLSVRVVERAARGVEIVAEDEGDGLAEPELALIDGFSEGRMLHEPSSENPEDPGARERRGLGLGLGAVRRLLTEVSFEQKEGGGLRVKGTKWLEADLHRDSESK